MNNDRVAKLDDEYDDIIDVLDHRHVPARTFKFRIPINTGKG